MLTDNCGTNALQTFGVAGIQVIARFSGQVRRAVEAYRLDMVSGTSAHNVRRHLGIHKGRREWRGEEGAIGARTRKSRGGQMSTRQAAAVSSGRRIIEHPFTGQEIVCLKSRLKQMEAQLDVIHRRLAALEGKQPAVALVAVVDPEKCVGCGLCEDICLRQAISVDLKAAIDQNQCIGCGQCAAECPQSAISLEKKPSGKPLVAQWAGR